jgi:hypothetical protein
VIENLSPGKHEIKLVLINPKGSTVENSAAVNSATIYVQ